MLINTTQILRLIFCSCMLVGAFSSIAQEDQRLLNQLLEMAEQQQEIRNDLAEHDQQLVPNTQRLLANQIDNLHAQTLFAIVKLHGWPNKQLVGKKGVLAAFNLVKQSSDLAFQQNMLPQIIQSFIDQDGLAGQDVATLTDKISIKQGNKQVFGTQVQRIDGKVVFAPIANVETVDQLRAQMGLSTLTEYKKTLEK